MGSNNLQPDIWSSVIITWTFATIALGLRFWARRITRIALSWDDYFLIVAYFFSIVFNVTSINWIFAGLGLHIGDVPGVPGLILRASAIHLFVAEMMYAATLGFVKFSILSFYWRVFGTSRIRIPIIVLFVLAAMWLIIRTFMSIFHCVPVHALWDGAANVPGAVCNINGAVFFVASTSAHLGLDILIISLPIIQIGQLQLRMVQKVGVSILFTFGTLVCIASICLVVHAVSFNPNTPDLTYDISWIVIWAAVEVNLAVISACLPLLRPIFLMLGGALGLGSGLHRSSDGGVGTGDYQNSRPKSFVRIGGFGGSAGGSKVGRSNDSDDAGSTYELAKASAAGGRSSRGIDGLDGSHGRAHVTITGTQIDSDEELQRWETGQGGMSANNGNMGGNGRIVVRNETSVQITHAR